MERVGALIRAALRKLRIGEHRQQEESLREGPARAAELIDSGAAMRKLDQLITESNQITATETR